MATPSEKATAAAYSATGDAWERGPGPIYDRLAQVLLEHARVPIRSAASLDVGAGTGAASRALIGAGAASVVAVDVARGMLAHGAAQRPPAVVADALALPFPAGTFDLTVAAFSMNHLPDPAIGLREAARVTRAGGGVLASAYGADDDHPVKAAVEAALMARGWAPEPWYEVVRSASAPRLATVAGARSAATAAGLDAQVVALRVPFPQLGPARLVAWRLGLAQHAPFVASLATDTARAELAADAAARLGRRWPPLERSVIVVTAVSR